VEQGMRDPIKQKVKLSLIAVITTLMLAGCGSSSKEEQSNWLELWNARYESKIKMLNACFKEAGISLQAKQMTPEQNAMANECELNYITAAAAKDGITLDKEIIENSILQLKF
jgi:Tfp pilus assembly protein PilP